ncbi:hypothetical protein ZWY2020_041993 [Hordeum vulgare]|nr:hypothetical protein ZWY2020_041993 [Hordeum vulgare]
MVLLTISPDLFHTQELFQCHQNNFSVDAYYLQLKTLADELRDIGVKIDDDTLLITLTTGVNEDFDNAAANLLRQVRALSPAGGTSVKTCQEQGHAFYPRRRRHWRWSTTTACCSSKAAGYAPFQPSQQPPLLPLLQTPFHAPTLPPTPATSHCRGAVWRLPATTAAGGRRPSSTAIGVVAPFTLGLWLQPEDECHPRVHHAGPSGASTDPSRAATPGSSGIRCRTTPHGGYPPPPLQLTGVYNFPMASPSPQPALPPAPWDPALLIVLHNAPSPNTYTSGGDWYMDDTGSSP